MKNRDDILEANGVKTSQKVAKAECTEPTIES